MKTIITLSEGSTVECEVEYAECGMWCAFEVEYDLGKPVGSGCSPHKALDDLTIELESRLPEVNSNQPGR